jgi:hypothetical protein
VASKEVRLVVVIVLSLFVFRVGALHAVILLRHLPLHHIEARDERGGQDPGTTA